MLSFFIPLFKSALSALILFFKVLFFNKKKYGQFIVSNTGKTLNFNPKHGYQETLTDLVLQVVKSDINEITFNLINGDILWLNTSFPNNPNTIKCGSKLQNMRFLVKSKSLIRIKYCDEFENIFTQDIEVTPAFFGHKSSIPFTSIADIKLGKRKFKILETIKRK